MYRLSNEEYESLMDFLDGRNSAILETNVPDKIFSLAERLSKAMSKEALRLRKKTILLEHRLYETDKKREQLYQEGNFKCIEMDTVMLFQAICYCLYKTQSAYEIRMDDRDLKSKSMMLLFSLYSIWLYKHKERICLDHPQAIEQGPWFWKAIKQTLKGASSYEESYRTICNASAEVAAIIKRLCEKHSYEKASETCKNYRMWNSYKVCHKDKNFGKWNKTLDDGMIYLDRKNLAEKQQNM